MATRSACCRCRRTAKMREDTSSGAQEAFAASGCDLVQMLETRGLTINEAVTQANDLLTAHPDVTAIYGMYDEAGTGAAKVRGDPRSAGQGGNHGRRRLARRRSTC